MCCVNSRAVLYSSSSTMRHWSSCWRPTRIGELCGGVGGAGGGDDDGWRPLYSLLSLLRCLFLLWGWVRERGSWTGEWAGASSGQSEGVVERENERERERPWRAGLCVAALCGDGDAIVPLGVVAGRGVGGLTVTQGSVRAMASP